MVDGKTQVTERKPVDLKYLSDAFAIFNETTARLEQAHRELEKKVAEVGAELERKNQALAQANVQLEQQNRELDRVRSYLKDIIDSMASGLITVDLAGQITTFNRAAEEILGLTAKKVTNQNWRQLFPSDSQLLNWLEEEPPTSFLNRELTICGAKGEQIPIRASLSPILDRNENQIGYSLIFSDLSKIRLLEEKARRNDRLTALGELAAGVAHEMRNPLTTKSPIATSTPSSEGLT